MTSLPPLSSPAPEKPAIIRPVRRIREALGLTQAEMAERLDVFQGTIEKLENGTMKMPPELAYKYCIETGCDLRSGLEGEGEVEVVYEMGGLPYTLEGFKEHQRILNGLGEDEAIASAVLSLQLFLEASKTKKSLPQMTRKFEVLLLKSLHDADLSRAFLKALRDRATDIPLDSMARIVRLVGKVS